MCTLIALHRCVDGLGLVVAGNRDEYYARPSEGPALRSTSAGPLVAPLDVRAGGTWFGVNAHRVFVAVTNRPSANLDPARRSRGQVVIDALAATSAVDAARILGSLPAGLHNPFNAFAADGDRAFTFVYEEKGGSGALGGKEGEMDVDVHEGEDLALLADVEGDRVDRRRDRSKAVVAQQPTDH